MQQRSIFDGIPREELQEVLAGFERRRFESGSVVLAEGDSLFETYVVESGAADVFVSDSEGQEHRIGFVAPGGTLGEMSMFTGEPAAGTVRAATDLDVYVIGEADFEQLAARYPLIYRNIGAILSERLDRSNRRPLRDTTGRATILRDWGAPPLLGYAIACSIAWHIRQPTLLLILDDSPSEELREVVRSAPRPRLRPRRADRSGHDGRPARDACADVMLLTSVLDFVTATLAARIEDLHPMYEHVLVQVRGSQQALAYHAKTVHLVAADGRAPLPADGSERVVRAWAAPEGPRNPGVDGVVSVPELERDEVERLRTGLVSSGTAAGDALGWIARDLCGLKVGLALGGGSAKGYAHLGALRVLIDAGLPIDYLAGTSIGAAIAGFYALGFDMDQAAEEMDRLGPRAFRPHLSMRSLLSTKALRRGMRTLCGQTRIEDLPVPLALTAADISNGQEIVFRQGLLWPAVLASMAIPGIFPAQRIGDHTLVDGGVFHPVPSNVVAEMGADVVIGVRLMQATEARAEVVATEPSGRVPSIFGTIVRSVELMQSRISARTAATATILITPMETEIEFEHVGLRRWKAARQYIRLGEAAAEAALPRLAAALPWMRRLDGAAESS